MVCFSVTNIYFFRLLPCETTLFSLFFVAFRVLDCPTLQPLVRHIRKYTKKSDTFATVPKYRKDEQNTFIDLQQKFAASFADCRSKRHIIGVSARQAFLRNRLRSMDISARNRGHSATRIDCMARQTELEKCRRLVQPFQTTPRQRFQMYNRRLSADGRNRSRLRSAVADTRTYGHRRRTWENRLCIRSADIVAYQTALAMVCRQKQKTIDVSRSR